jgi:CheY-like chemotaxis protein
LLYRHFPTTADQPRAAMTVLVVDDDPVVRLLLETTIQGGPYRVLTASDGDEALATARRIHPTVILLDVSMPKLDGFEVCQRIKNDPVTKDITVIMITAKAQADDRARGQAVGVDAYITKPFSPLQLLESLDRQLQS